MQAGHDLRKAEALKAEADALKNEVAKRQAEIEQREQLKRENPLKYLESVYGPEYWDLLSRAKLDGVPPAQLIAAEVREHVSLAKKETAAELEKIRNEQKERIEAQERADAQRRELEVYSAADSHLSANESKYPHIFAEAEAYGVKPTLRHFIRQHFNDTTKRDDVTGEVIPGEVLTGEQAADRLEKMFQEAHQKRAKRLQPSPAATPAPQAGQGQSLSFKVVPQQTSSTPNVQRRTLSTDMTGSSVGTQPNGLTEAERLARFNATWDARMARKAS